MEQKQQSSQGGVKRKVPWRDVSIGFAIPKLIFFVGLNHGKPLIGGIIGICWSIAVFYITYLRKQRINIFAIIAIAMIIIRIAVVIVQRSAAFYFVAEAFDNAIYGLIFLVSLFFSRSLIQVFAEAVGMRISDSIRRTPYYSKAWFIITAVWGVTYLSTAALLWVLKINDMRLVARIDMLTGWPIMSLLLIFTIRFPGWYWKVKLGEVF